MFNKTNLPESVSDVVGTAIDLAASTVEMSSDVIDAAAGNLGTVTEAAVGLVGPVGRVLSRRGMILRLVMLAAAAVAVAGFVQLRRSKKTDTPDTIDGPMARPEMQESLA